jgi:hypothetical protein
MEKLFGLKPMNVRRLMQSSLFSFTKVRLEYRNDSFVPYSAQINTFLTMPQKGIS